MRDWDSPLSTLLWPPQSHSANCQTLGLDLEAPARPSGCSRVRPSPLPPFWFHTRTPPSLSRLSETFLALSEFPVPHLFQRHFQHHKKRCRLGYQRFLLCGLMRKPHLLLPTRGTSLHRVTLLGILPRRERTQ